MLRFARWTLPAVCLGFLPAAAVPARGADEPAASASAEQPDVTEDVTERVEIRTTGTLRSGRNGELFTGVTVTNTSDVELPGRLVVVVDDSGIEGVTAAENDGKLESGEFYVEVLPATGKLKPNARTSSKRLDFTSQDAVAAATRKDFAPEFRAFRIGPAAPVKDEPQPDSDPAEKNLEGKSYTQSRLEEVMRVQDKYTPQLIANEGVFGTATGEDDNGNPVILVYAQRHGIIKKLPGQFEGIPVEQAVVGTSFRAGPAYHAGFKGANNPQGGLKPQADSAQNAGTGIPTDPTQQFTPPLPIGVSMTNSEDPICSSGTIGCRIVFADGRLGALTNSHVAAHESQITAAKEDLAAGVLGDHWTQPGCADLLTVAVNPTPFTFARLVDFQDFIFTGQTTTTAIIFDPSLINYIDAAVGRISFPNDSLLLACTPDDGYGYPSRTPVAPVPGMRVMKYGRTTGLRRGKIRGINANVAVLYSTDLALFTNQISIYGDHSLFSMAGDSGSLVVTENGHHPVGLLFAGGGFETLANPMGLILERFNIAIDDGTGTPPRQGFNGATTTPGAGQSGRMGGAGGRLVP